MALELHEQVSAALLDVLHGGWAKYLELEDGTQVRTSWHSGEDGDEWLRVEHPETGHVRDFLVNVKTVDLGAPSPPEPAAWDPDNPGCAPEECGGSRLDPCTTIMRTKGVDHDGDRPVPDHPFEGGHSGMACVTMITRSDGTGDSCGLPADHHPKAQPPVPVERTWAEVCRGDQAQGGDGKFYPVIRAAAGTGPNAGFTVVTMDLGGHVDRSYNMPPSGTVLVIRGEVGAAADAFREGGMVPGVIRS
jgi:hypothetical protein